MPTTYTSASDTDEVHNIIADAIQRWHPDLREAQPTFDILFAYSSDLLAPALKLHGSACLALISVNSLEDRTKGCRDVTIKIDGKRWEELKHPQRLSLIDHELEHLVVKRTKAKSVKRDNLGRPKLALKPHDIEIGGFVCVIERHKQQSHEAQYIQAASKHVQGFFQWG